MEPHSDRESSHSVTDGPAPPSERLTAPTLVRAAVGGLVAGGVFIGLTMWFASTQGQSPLGPLKLIATLVLDGPAKEVPRSDAWIGMAIHAVYSAVLGLVFGLLVPWLRRYDALIEGGLVYGSLIYLFNFQILARTAIPQFLDVNQAVEASLHLLFGAVLAATLAFNLPEAALTQRSVLRWVAAVASSGVLLIHFATAHHHFKEAPYLGALFVLASTVLTAVAILLTRRNDRPAWIVGAVVHAALFIGLPLSRTTGLPGYYESTWPTLGTETLVLEAVYLLSFAVVAMSWKREDAEVSSARRESV